MYEVEDIVIYRYEVVVIINNNRKTVLVTNDLDIANQTYEKCIEKYSPNDDTNHTIILLYDYDQNANINYYDSEDEIC